MNSLCSTLKKSGRFSDQWIPTTRCTDRIRDIRQLCGSITPTNTLVKKSGTSLGICMNSDTLAWEDYTPYVSQALSLVSLET